MYFLTTLSPLLLTLSLTLTTLAHPANPPPPLKGPPPDPTKNLRYPFTLSASLASDGSKELPFGFAADKVGIVGALGIKTVFQLVDGKLIREVDNPKGGKGAKTVLEVGSAALRQPVILLPKGKGVPITLQLSSVEPGFVDIFIEVDTKSGFLFSVEEKLHCFFSFFNRLPNGKKKVED